jgi:hypothetical protein
MTDQFQENLPLSFSAIHQQELLEIQKRREKNSYDPAEFDEELVGLALSGGGIRSATFCLGFLQELQRLRLLRIFDYLSTVSGGGYLGGWWSAWLSRQQDDAWQNPSFEIEDIRNPVNLLRRINEAHGFTAHDLKEQLQTTARGRKLLEVLDRDDLTRLAPRLYEPLTEELNTYIQNAPTEAEKQLRKTDLIETFPCELRDIFPRPEQIEPERKRIIQEYSDTLSWKEDPIHHIRLFADYLTPPKGIFNAGTWRAISTITRNLILTWLILLSLFVGVMLLGQAYLFLHPSSQTAFTCFECLPENSKTVLLVILTPVVILLVSNVVMGIAWLLCNQDSSSSLDSVTQWACLIALAALIIAAIFAIPSLRAAIANYFALPFTLKYVLPRPWGAPIPEALAQQVTRLRVLIIWLAVLLGYILLAWHWRLKGNQFVDGYASSTVPASSKQEIRRARFGRAQSRLLVTTAIVAAVLLVSWLTPLVLRENRITLGMKIPLTLLPLLWNLRGSIFATLEDTPAFFADRAERKKASLASRFIFAATPLLVVGVLAIAAAAFANWLLLSLYNQNSQFQTISVLVNVAAFLSITLCMGLAIYELKAVFRASFLLVLFLGLVMINTVWEAQALLQYTNESTEVRWLYLLGTSACSAILITAFVFRKMMPRGKWKWRLVRHLNVVRSRIKGRRENQRLLRMGSMIAAVLLFTSLTFIGLLIGYGIYLNSVRATTAGRLSGAVVLTLLALGGGVILFEVLVRHDRTWSGENRVTLRLFSHKEIGRRPEALWLAQAVCVTLPIVMISVSHNILWYRQAHSPQAWNQSMTLFPLTVGLLLLSVIVLRSLVIQKQLLEEKPILGWPAGIIEWLFDRIAMTRGRRRVYQAMALSSIGFVVLLDTVTRVIYSGNTTTALLSSRLGWKLLVVSTCVCLPVFVISLFQIPFNASSYPFLRQGKPRWPHTQIFLIFVATICVGVALIAGSLLPNWLTHVSEIPLHTGLTPLLLPLAAGCFLVGVFEFGWGQGDNQRSVVLIAVAYFAVTSIFFMQLTGAGLNWYLVLGLLAAICVWVGALGWVVDPNSVSMHQFYKERLVRAYLGASNVRRFRHRPKGIAETVAGDDLPLRSLLNCERGGPYHLINTTLNLAAGRDLAAQRSTSSFVLSQHHCGSTRTNYCDTNEYMKGKMTLGTAVAVSGAPVSSNLGARKPTASLARLMTLLNVRLGYWAPTPNRAAQYSSQPRLWPFYLVRELFSQTNELSDYCYLSDGGDFDNTGLYSLIERGCRFVVLVDCGADSKPPSFEDLGEAIRRCRIDFSTEINLNLESLVKSESPAPCFVVGKIRFAEQHLRSLGRNDYRSPEKRYGTIVYFKPSVIQNVSADVWQYAIGNEFFPQQPTPNQWFGEAQFESYRRLGQACAHSAFGWIRSENHLENGGRLSLRKIEALFTQLYAQTQKT